MPAKFVQIAVSSSDQNNESVYALDSKGDVWVQVWALDNHKRFMACFDGKWERLSTERGK